MVVRTCARVRAADFRITGAGTRAEIPRARRRSLSSLARDVGRAAVLRIPEFVRRARSLRAAPGLERAYSEAPSGQDTYSRPSGTWMRNSGDCSIPARAGATGQHHRDRRLRSRRAVWRALSLPARKLPLPRVAPCTADHSLPDPHPSRSAGPAPVSLSRVAATITDLAGNHGSPLGGSRFGRRGAARRRPEVRVRWPPPGSNSIRGGDQVNRPRWGPHIAGRRLHALDSGRENHRAAISLPRIRAKNAILSTTCGSRECSHSIARKPNGASSFGSLPRGTRHPEMAVTFPPRTCISERATAPPPPSGVQDGQQDRRRCDSCPAALDRPPRALGRAACRCASVRMGVIAPFGAA